VLNFSEINNFKHSRIPGITGCFRSEDVTYLLRCYSARSHSCRTSLNSRILFIDKFIANMPVENLYSLPDAHFDDIFGNKLKAKLHGNLLIRGEERCFTAGSDKITSEKAFKCSKECCALYLHIAAILEFTRFKKRISQLENILPKVKQHIAKQESTIRKVQEQ
jgi:hypothetical protein